VNRWEQFGEVGKEFVGFDRVDKGTICDVIRGVAKRMPGPAMPNVITGIHNDETKNHIKAGNDFIYIDHAYFKRGWEKGNFRAIRKGVHLTKILDRPKDRLKRWEVKIEPWRKTGREIVIIPLSERQKALYDAHDWQIQVESRLCEITDRPVVAKNQKTTSMRDFCRDTWAVVTYASVAGVEAALMGIPVISTSQCPSWPVSGGTLEKIEIPEYPDNRAEWAASLTYATWNTRELLQIKWRGYDYENCVHGS
jgi:hypothetical protein